MTTSPDDRRRVAELLGREPSGSFVVAVRDAGGTRVGVKCLHAHYAYHLAGGDDPVGRWVHNTLNPPQSGATQ
mgnify:CR=1 FL=1